jgi:diacylglycerol O-acyltransferase
VLDTVCAALRPLFEARGELSPGLTLRASVPVSLRTGGDIGGGGNVVGGMLVDLPVGEADAGPRLRAIVESTRHAKATQSAAMLPQLIGRIARFSQWIFAHQHWVNVFVTNVPGPSAPLELLGTRIIDLVPIASPAGNVTVTFAALSYAGSLYVSATADASYADFSVLAEAMRRLGQG